MNPEPYRKRTLEEIEADLGALTPEDRAALSRVLSGLDRVEPIEVGARCDRCRERREVLAGDVIEVGPDGRWRFRCPACRRAERFDRFMVAEERRRFRTVAAYVLGAIAAGAVLGFAARLLFPPARGFASSPAWEESPR
jgi:hypothetical protein